MKPQNSNAPVDIEVLDESGQRVVEVKPTEMKTASNPIPTMDDKIKGAITNRDKDPNAPWIDIHWVRFAKDPAANLGQAVKEPKAFGIYGGKGKGKSALNENISDHYPVVIDVFGARDNESLAWCRSHRQDSILFLKGDSTEISCDPRWHVANTREVTLEQIGQHKAVISCSAFYANLREEWAGINNLMDRLWKRTYWTTPWCLVIREAANLLYSRVALGENQSQAKNYIIYVLREMRHCGFALTLDSIRWYALDIDVRSICDYTFLKALGIDGLPDSLHFLYGYFDPYGVMRMGKEKFIVISRDGPIGTGTFSLPYWHKTEKENLFKILNIQLDRGEAPNMANEERGTVNDFQHVKIIETRQEINPKTGKPKGMQTIAEELHYSPITVSRHINWHNEDIQNGGSCTRCRRAKSKLQSLTINKCLLTDERKTPELKALTKEKLKAKPKDKTPEGEPDLLDETFGSVG